MFSLDGFSHYPTFNFNFEESKSNQQIISNQNSEDELFLTEIVINQNNEEVCDKEAQEKNETTQLLTEHDIDQFLTFIMSQRNLWPTLDGIRNHIKTRNMAITSGKVSFLSGVSGLGLCLIRLGGVISFPLFTNLGFGVAGSVHFFAITSFLLFLLAEKFFSTQGKRKDGYTMNQLLGA